MLPVADIAYAYFGEVAKLGSIRQAAENLHVSASSISRQIAKLEREFGMPLLVRHAQGTKLTPAGQILAQFVRGRSRELQRLKTAMNALKSLESGHLSIYTVEDMLGGFLPRVLSDFAARHPGLTYEVVVRGTDDVMRAVAEDRCDIGISFHPYPRPDVEAVLRIRQPLLAVMPPGHRLAGRPRLALADLTREPIGLPDRSFGIRHLVDQAIKSEQVDLTIRMETNSIEMTRQFALSGLGVTFLPAFSFEREIAAGTLIGVELENETLATASTEICKRAETEPTFAAQEFLEAVAQAIGRLNRCARSNAVRP